RAYDAATGQIAWQLPAAEGMWYGHAFTPDGKRVVLQVCQYGVSAVRVRDAATGRVERTLIGNAGQGAAWALSPDGKRFTLAEVHQYTSEPPPPVVTWDLDTGKEV